MDYYQFEFKIASENVEMLMALVGNLAFESFEETETGFHAYVQEKKYEDQMEKDIEEMKSLFDFSYQKKLIKYQNWNAVWESNFQPILVNNFCGIRADFHEPLTEVKHEIVINPKMAFGTGHHETTWMMMDTMENLDFKNKTVFDYGCGTGILAILAAQLGAASIDALDIELPSYENTLENSRINGIENIESIHGTLEKTQDKSYDIILANINRHVILDSLSTLYQMLPKAGILLLSGILKTDEQFVKTAAEKSGFKIEKIQHRNSWICIKCLKR